MKTQPAIPPFLISLVFGTALWMTIITLTGKREAWDATTYWTIAYPATVLIAALLGYVYPKHSWRWPVVIFLAQFLTMLIKSGEVGSLWPLGLLMFLCLALPAIIAAKMAAICRLRADKKLPADRQ